VIFFTFRCYDCKLLLGGNGSAAFIWVPLDQKPCMWSQPRIESLQIRLHVGSEFNAIRCATRRERRWFTARVHAANPLASTKGRRCPYRFSGTSGTQLFAGVDRKRPTLGFDLQRLWRKDRKREIDDTGAAYQKGASASTPAFVQTAHVAKHLMILGYPDVRASLQAIPHSLCGSDNQSPALTLISSHCPRIPCR